MLSGGPKWQRSSKTRNFPYFLLLCALPCDFCLEYLPCHQQSTPMLQAFALDNLDHKAIFFGENKGSAQNRSFWVSAVSVVRRAFLEPSRSISCKSGLPPALPASVGEARQPGKWPSCPSGRLGKSGPGPPSGKGPPHASSNAVGWPKMPHREGVPRTRPPNPDFLGFCGLCGAEGISRA